MNRPYNVFYNNITGRVVVEKNKIPEKNNDINFQKKVEELYNIINKNKELDIDAVKHIKQELDKKNNNTPILSFKESDKKNNTPILSSKEYIMKKELDKKNNLSILFSNENIKKSLKKELLFGIKKTILSDFNYLNNSSNSNDFKIGINKNLKNNNVFDTFYLFPNISEINTKMETNIVNEKKIEIFINKNNINDKQYFPIDFVSCGITIPLRSNDKKYSKLILRNILWNLFQSIDINKYYRDELLCIVPEKNEFVYKSIKLQINFELHSQITKNVLDIHQNNILPYSNFNFKVSPANTCLFPCSYFEINNLNGIYNDEIVIDLCTDINIMCALLCVRISVPDDCIQILKGLDKIDKVFYGYIPFSQFILQFDYELL